MSPNGVTYVPGPYTPLSKGDAIFIERGRNAAPQHSAVILNWILPPASLRNALVIGGVALPVDAGSRQLLAF